MCLTLGGGIWHHRRSPTRVRAQVSFEGGVAGKRAVAVAADVAVHSCVDLHVLLQGLLGLEALRTQQTEHRHVSPWRSQETQTQSYFSTVHRQGLKWGNWVTFTLCESSEGKASFKEQVSLPKTNSPKSLQALSASTPSAFYFKAWKWLFFFKNFPHIMRSMPITPAMTPFLVC